MPCHAMMRIPNRCRGLCGHVGTEANLPPIDRQPAADDGQLRAYALLPCCSGFGPGALRVPGLKWTVCPASEAAVDGPGAFRMSRLVAHAALGGEVRRGWAWTKTGASPNQRRRWAFVVRPYGRVAFSCQVKQIGLGAGSSILRRAGVDGADPRSCWTRMALDCHTTPHLQSLCHATACGCCRSAEHNAGPSTQAQAQASSPQPPHPPPRVRPRSLGRFSSRRQGHQGEKPPAPSDGFFPPTTPPTGARQERSSVFFFLFPCLCRTGLSHVRCATRPPPFVDLTLLQWADGRCCFGSLAVRPVAASGSRSPRHFGEGTDRGRCAPPAAYSIPYLCPRSLGGCSASHTSARSWSVPWVRE